MSNKNGQEKNTAKLPKNICCICGKERIVVRVWKEKIDDSIIENTETACPDKDCQQRLDRDILNQKKKRMQMEERKKESLKNRKIAIHNKRMTKGVKTIYG
jgi:hypothetical protein